MTAPTRTGRGVAALAVLAAAGMLVAVAARTGGDPGQAVLVAGWERPGAYAVTCTAPVPGRCGDYIPADVNRRGWTLAVAVHRGDELRVHVRPVAPGLGRYWCRIEHPPGTPVAVDIDNTGTVDCRHFVL